MKNTKHFVQYVATTATLILANIVTVVAEGKILVDKTKVEEAFDPIWNTILWFVSYFGWFAMIFAYVFLAWKYKGDENKDQNKQKYVSAAFIIFILGMILINIDKFVGIFANKGRY